MIENVPTEEELRLISLRLYFRAWADTANIITEWAEYGILVTEDTATEEDNPQWHAYIEAAQSDLQAIYTLIQQSQEIGLKASICGVSPFLLLKRTDVKPSDEKAGIWDFTDFPTLDASELVRVHNIFCSTTSKEFQATYEDIRRSRNKISHLGIYKQRIEPQMIIGILQTQYAELYPKRRWMEDRLNFAALGRWGDAFSDSDFNERTGLFSELAHLIPVLSDEQFKCLMRHDRAESAFLCHECGIDAGVRNLGVDHVPTAYSIDESHVRCIVCERDHSIQNAAPCPVTDCGCELQSDEDGFEGQCMACGWEPREWAEAQKRRTNNPSWS